MVRQKQNDHTNADIDPVGGRVFAEKFSGVKLKELHLEPKFPIVAVITFDGSIDALLAKGLITDDMIANAPRRVHCSWDPGDSGYWETKRKKNLRVHVHREIGDEISDSDVLAPFAPKNWPLVGNAADARVRIEEDTNHSLDDMIGALWGHATRIRHRQRKGLRVTRAQREWLFSIVAQCCDQLEQFRDELKVEREGPPSARTVD